MVKDEHSEKPVQNLATQPIEPATGPDMEQIFREHATRVMSAAYRVTGSAQDAEDVLQTVFMRLVRREGTVQLQGNPAAYLHRAAVNAAVDLVRSRRTSRATPLDDAAGKLAAPETGAADRKLASGELRDEVRKALETVHSEIPILIEGDGQPVVGSEVVQILHPLDQVDRLAVDHADAVQRDVEHVLGGPIEAVVLNVHGEDVLALR